jgi:hypothetical protein
VLRNRQGDVLSDQGDLAGALAAYRETLALIAYSYLASVVSRVYLCALYVYATDGVVPNRFDGHMMHSGWKVKKA